MAGPVRLQLVLIALLATWSTACMDRPSPFDTRDHALRSDRTAPVDPPNSYPEWAYDAPDYVKPAANLPPEPRVREKDPLHYFTNKKTVMVRRPSGYKPAEVPRVAIWYTDNNGFDWSRAGYFGRDQTYFPLLVEADGDYGVRFAGPGQMSALEALPTPVRVYHVDTAAPEIEVVVAPKQTWYHVGQDVTVSWDASDYHLVPRPVRLGVLADFASNDGPSIELSRDLEQSGSMTYTIPADMLGYSIRFRADALDRAGNLGLAYSHGLQVIDPSVVWTSDDAGDRPVGAPHDAENTRDERSSAVLQSVASATVAQEAAADLVMVERPAAAPPVAPTESTPITAERDEPGGQSSDRPTTAGEPANRRPGSAWIVSIRDAARSATQTITAIWNSRHRLPTPEPEAVARADMDGADGPPRTPSASPERAAAPPPQAPVIVAVDRNDAGDDATPISVAPASPTSIEPMNVEPVPGGSAPEEEACPPDEYFADVRRMSGAGDRPFDPTGGNGLVVPLPATVAAADAAGAFATAHPWRSLRPADPDAPGDGVWRLPRPRFGDALYRLYEGRFFAEQERMRPTGDPPEARPALAGGPDLSESKSGVGARP